MTVLKRAPVATLALALLLAPAILPAGGAMKSPINVEARLGVRFMSSLPEKVRAGTMTNAVVQDPTKLAQLGLSGLKRGATVRLTMLADEQSFSVEAGRQRIVLAISESGITPKR